MTRYLIKRVAFLIVTFFIITFLLYSMFSIVPYSPMLVSFQDPGEYYGADSSLIARYARWMGLVPDGSGGRYGILQGNLGYSGHYGGYVTDVIKIPFKNTLIFNLLSTTITLAITIPLGIYCAVKARSRTDTAIQTVTTVGSSLPMYLIALIAIFIFSVKLGLFPSGGSKTPGSGFTGLRDKLDRLYCLTLPVMVSVSTGLTGMTRTVRAAMMDTLTMDYIKTARAKGLTEKVVIYSHAWRNALIPIATSLTDWVTGIFAGGSLVIETTFCLWGTGNLFWEALTKCDFELAMGLELIFIVASLLGRLAADIFYTMIDPRIKFD